MMAGVVVHPSKGAQFFAVAFPGRMETGKYFLEHQANGFALSHGARHIYNMNGGKVFEAAFPTGSTTVIYCYRLLLI
jgi:hypothetical protein